MNINSVSTPILQTTTPAVKNEAAKPESATAAAGDKVELGSNTQDISNTYSQPQIKDKITPEKARLYASLAATGFALVAGAAVVGLSGGNPLVAAGIGAAFGGVAGSATGAAFGGLTGLLLAQPGKGMKIGAVVFGLLGAAGGAAKALAITGLAGALGGGAATGAALGALLSIF
ncbi:MAG: hypothetical protein LWY06_20190 [Firmicutes bacterium]|nr:hypothetical protein [Bacillota bacterium]